MNAGDDAAASVWMVFRSRALFLPPNNNLHYSVEAIIETAILIPKEITSILHPQFLEPLRKLQTATLIFKLHTVLGLAAK